MILHGDGLFVIICTMQSVSNLTHKMCIFIKKPDSINEVRLQSIFLAFNDLNHHPGIRFCVFGILGNLHPCALCSFFFFLSVQVYKIYAEECAQHHGDDEGPGRGHHKAQCPV